MLGEQVCVCVCKSGAFCFLGGKFFFLKGDSVEKARQRERAKREEFLVFFSLSSTHTLSRLLYSLAREGSGHVGLADGGLGGQDSDLFFFLKEDDEEQKSEHFFLKKVFLFPLPRCRCCAVNHLLLILLFFTL